MNTTIKISFALLMGAMLFITGCKKNDTATGTAMLMLHLHANIGADEIDPLTTYQNPSGKNIQITRAEYYLSGIKMIKTDGSSVPVSGTYLVKWPQEEYMIGNVPAGSYKSITFNLGVQPADNTDPSAHTGTDLAAQTPSMHFPTTADGYIFLAVEGLVDSNGAFKNFGYHIGKTSALQTVTMGDHTVAPYSTYVATAGGSIEVHMIADFNKLFGTLDMSTNTTNNAQWISDQLAHNIPGIFEYEE